MANPAVDKYIQSAKSWQAEMEEIRRILLDFELTESIKWRNPCYNYHGSNLFIIGPFKEYCALSFFTGTLLKDAEEVLESPGENSQAARLIKFRTVKEVVELEPVIRSYVREAMDLTEAGEKVVLKKTQDPIPEEFQVEMDKNEELSSAFKALTPGRQRGYLLFFAGAKQAATRTARVEKYRQRILDGIGINDCVCGFSKRKPTCDGSHKYIV
jgi:uncharacterized protein YdeI (YjbR/CyaY-like superfamily)